MSEAIITRMDRVIDHLRTSGWAVKAIHLAPTDLEALRLAILGDCGAWVKPDGIEAYRDIPLAAEGQESGIEACRDGAKRTYPVS